MFQAGQNDKTLEINMICVSPKETDENLVTELVKWSENEAKKCGIEGDIRLCILQDSHFRLDLKLNSIKHKKQSRGI